MSKKKNKKILQGMEHLYQNLTPDTSLSSNVDNTAQTSNNTEIDQNIDLNKESYLKKELLVISLIMIFLFGTLAIILYFDNSNNFLRTLAEKLTSWY